MASFKADHLIGKSNFVKWNINVNVKLYFEINGYWPYIINNDLKPTKSLYYNNDKPKTDELAVKYSEKEFEYNKNANKALGAIKSIISLDTIERFKDKETAFDLYQVVISIN
jgi:hypothetical protein